MPPDKAALALKDPMSDRPTIDDLLALMTRLRDPKSGCPWDLAQSFRTALPYTLEEAYEVAEAIENDDMDALRDELGDLLFQVVFHAGWLRSGVALRFRMSCQPSAAS